MGFLGGFWGQGLRYLVGTRLGMQSFGKKNCGDALNTLVCTRGKEITKKRKKREGYTLPLRSAYPP